MIGRVCLVLCCVLVTSLSLGQETPDPQLVKQALHSSVEYFHQNVSRHGGYVYHVTEDFSEFWGEGKLDEHAIVTQPPSTPTVGMAFLKAFEATGDPAYLTAARDAAYALISGQLKSGGWTQVIFFEPTDSRLYGNYRNRKGGKRNYSSLDDGQTQNALRFLIQTDRALHFHDPVIHEAVDYALTNLYKAQFPNGGFPQVWEAPSPRWPVLKARFPEGDWSADSTLRIKKYWNYYTLNDGLAGAMAELLMEAHDVYQDGDSLNSLRGLANFLVRAQLPEPQPAWAQQYNEQMVPMWARKFEPPAVTGAESQDVMFTLIRLAVYLDDLSLLEPIPKAVKYFREKCLLPNGKVARYYELKTNRPLYMTSDYNVTYDDSDAPSHYSWTWSAKFDQIERDYLLAMQGKYRLVKPKGTKQLSREARQALETLDSQGRWVSTYTGERLVGQPKFPKGTRYLASGVFAENVEALSEYLIRLKQK